MMNAGAAQAFVQCMEKIAYAQGEIASMVAENMQRQVEGKSMAYVENDFMRVVESMRGQVADNASWITNG